MIAISLLDSHEDLGTHEFPPFPNSRLRWFTLASLILIGVNTKFSCSLYLIAFVLSLLVFVVLYRRTSTWNTICFAVSSLILGILALGFFPFVTNFVSTGNPFFPVNLLSYSVLEKTTAAQPLVYYHLPQDLVDLSGIEKLALSLGSLPSSSQTSSFITNATMADFLESYKTFHIPDLQRGALGALFLPAFILSILSLLANMFILKTRQAEILALGTFFISIPAFLNPEAWWLRYAPQIYLIPLLLALPGISQNRWFPKTLGTSVIAILLFNSWLVVSFAVPTVTSHQ